MLRSEQETEDEGINVSSRIFGFLILGIALVFIGIAILVIASFSSNSPGSAGIVIFIGPIPIAISSGPSAGWLLLIGIILAALSIALFLVINRRIEKFSN
jgi:uncharacterized membrane protein